MFRPLVWKFGRRAEKSAPSKLSNTSSPVRSLIWPLIGQCWRLGGLSLVRTLWLLSTEAINDYQSSLMNQTSIFQASVFNTILWLRYCVKTCSEWFNARKTLIFNGISLGGVIIGAHFISRLVRQIRSGLFSPPGPCFKYSLFSKVIILWITFCQEGLC